MRLLFALDTPRAVVIAVLLILAVNGFLFFKQRDSSPSANVRATSDLAAQSETTQQKPSPKATTNRTKEETRQQASRQKTNKEETNRERTNRRETTGRQTGQKPTNGGERTQQKGTSRKQTAGERTGKANERTGGKEPQKQAPSAGSKRSLADLGGAVGRCRGSGDGCIRDFVLGVYPGARYIAGRTDLATGRGSANMRVLYFETPKMKTCQYSRESYRPPNGPGYTVIVVGEGSFDAKRGNGCIPTA